MLLTLVLRRPRGGRLEGREQDMLIDMLDQ
jgi:hypothetical protein